MRFFLGKTIPRRQHHEKLFIPLLHIAKNIRQQNNNQIFSVIPWFCCCKYQEEKMNIYY